MATSTGPRRCSRRSRITTSGSCSATDRRRPRGTSLASRISA
jgi:hypothetical protein